MFYNNDYNGHMLFVCFQYFIIELLFYTNAVFTIVFSNFLP